MKKYQQQFNTETAAQFNEMEKKKRAEGTGEVSLWRSITESSYSTSKNKKEGNVERSTVI
jgi:hypothetical protein